MKTLGIILLLVGLAGAVIFGIQAINNSEAFSVLGVDVAVSDANWTPVIVSGVVAIIGVIVLAVRGKK